MMMHPRRARETSKQDAFAGAGGGSGEMRLSTVLVGDAVWSLDMPRRTIQRRQHSIPNRAAGKGPMEVAMTSGYSARNG